MNARIESSQVIDAADLSGERWMDTIKPHNSTYFTPAMLQRTSDLSALDAAWTGDYLALERMARSLRQDYLAHAVYAGQLWLSGKWSDAARAVGRVVGLIVRALAPLGRSTERMFDALAANAVRNQRARRETYLDQSLDVYDLERRMRELEQQRRYSI